MLPQYLDYRPSLGIGKGKEALRRGWHRPLLAHVARFFRCARPGQPSALLARPVALFAGEHGRPDPAAAETDAAATTTAAAATAAAAAASCRRLCLAARVPVAHLDAAHLLVPSTGAARRGALQRVAARRERVAALAEPAADTPDARRPAAAADTAVHLLQAVLPLLPWRAPQHCQQVNRPSLSLSFISPFYNELYYIFLVLYF